MERQGPGAVVGDDAAREVASHRFRRAGIRAEERAVVVVVDHDGPFDRPPDVLRPYESTGRVADAGTKPERVGATGVGRRRQREGEVGHELASVRPACAPEADETV